MRSSLTLSDRDLVHVQCRCVGECDIGAKRELDKKDMNDHQVHKNREAGKAVTGNLTKISLAEKVNH